MPDVTTLAEFTAKERQRRERYAADRYRWTRSLAVGNDRLWRCPRCGGWRYRFNDHVCVSATGSGWWER